MEGRPKRLRIAISRYSPENFDQEKDERLDPPQPRCARPDRTFSVFPKLRTRRAGAHASNPAPRASSRGVTPRLAIVNPLI